MKVKCNSTQGCKEAKSCGAVEAHTYDKDECGHCPLNPDARCRPSGPCYMFEDRLVCRWSKECLDCEHDEI